MSMALPDGHNTQTGWQAHLSLDFKHGVQNRTHMRVHHRNGPLAVQKALYPEGGICHALLLHPPGGLVGGDSLRLDIGVRKNAHALLTTPGAGKWYRSTGAVSRFEQTLEVDADAVLEYLPQEAIVFDGALGENRIDAHLQGNAKLIGWDIVALGRPASGEAFLAGSLSQKLHIRRDGRLLLGENARYAGGDRLLDSPLGLAGRRVTGTLFASGPGIAGHLAAVRSALPISSPVVGATAWDDILVVRVLDDSAQRARHTLETAWAALRRDWLGLAAVPPRIWST